jgi:enhancer of mRNA-decapping protein 4
MDEMKSNQTVELEAVKETRILPGKKERPGKHSEQTVDIISEWTITTDKYSVDDSQAQADRSTPSKQTSEPGAENVGTGETEAPDRTDGPCASRDLHIPSATKEGKVMHPQVSGRFTPSISTVNSTGSLHEPQSNTNPPVESSQQAAAIQGTLQQLISMYSDLQKQLSTIVSAPIAKEGKRIEASLSRNMEKSIKANVDAMWARFQEENVRHEKTERDRMHQMANLVTTSVNKDIPVMRRNH